MKSIVILLVSLLPAMHAIAQNKLLQGVRAGRQHAQQVVNKTDAIKPNDNMKNRESAGNGKGYFISTVAAIGNRDTHGLRDGEAFQAQFNSPVAIITDALGNLLIADQRNYRIRMLNAMGMVYTFAGNHQSQEDGADGGFYSPVALCLDLSGDLLVVDKNWNAIRKVTSRGIITITGGNEDGYKDGNLKEAQFHLPSGIATDSKGAIFICDEGNHRIRKISGTAVSTFAGGEAGYQDGKGNAAQFMYPLGIVIDSKDVIYVAEHNRIRKITPDGMVSTFAGVPDAQGHKDGKGADALFSKITSIAVAEDGSLYVGDVGANEGNSIRHITTDGFVTTIAGGSVRTFNPKSVEERATAANDGPVTHANVGYITALCIGADNSIYYCEGYFHCIRKVWKN